MFGISMWELLLVGVILFLVVGPAKLPGLAKQLGNGLKDLRKGLSDIKGTVDKDDEFVKAVTDARRTVVEAKESFRSLIEDVTNLDDEDDEDEVVDRDPAPKPVPRGLKMVSPGKSRDEAPGETSAEPPVASPGPALADAPVEAEDWRASRRGGAAAPDAESAVPDAPIRKSGTGRRMVRPGRNSGANKKPE